ncbi:hypothetical protein FS749_006078 [Ceratobasidium sp. UAMH 11750]|nr:hypothetical protein FS749_006078 [Ceratobasidium sp. UAMH 11750]
MSIPQGFRCLNGLYSQRFEQDGHVLLGRDFFDVATVQNARSLGIFNKEMTKMRIQARTASLTEFHHLVAELDKFKRLKTSYTQNFDGLLTRDSPCLKAKTFELHGSNNELFCPICHRQPSAPVSDFDSQLLESGLVECPHCREDASKAIREGKRRSSVGYLIPNILLNQQPATSDQARAIITSTKRDAKVDLLLVVATSLKTHGTFLLAKDMAANVHAYGGVAVYVDNVPMRKSLAGLFDMQLQVDVQGWAACMRAVKYQASASFIEWSLEDSSLPVD